MSVVLNITNVLTLLFCLVVLSYYVLILIPSKHRRGTPPAKSITVIMPAHNEGRYLERAIRAVLDATWPGRRQVIVIDDGSKDDTHAVAMRFKRSPGVTVLRTAHRGKARSINLGLQHATGELVAIVDGDSVIHRDALLEIARAVSPPDVAAACGVVRVRNRRRVLGMWLHIEQLYNSLMRMIFSKVGANITTPGPLSVYKRAVIGELGGFSHEGFSEDVDITIRIHRAGYRVVFAPRAVSDTYMPLDIKGFMRQRTRFIRGLINILKRHFRLGRHIIELYTLPLLLFTYLQAVIMGSFMLYQIVSGYVQYFTSQGIYLSADVVRFFFDWFSIIGTVKWAAGIFSGATPLTLITAAGFIATILTYPLYLMAIFKFERRIDLWHLIPLAFMFPFWLIIMLISILMIPEILIKNQYNIWKKNE